MQLISQLYLKLETLYLAIQSLQFKLTTDMTPIRDD